jgi:ferrochelatase
LAAADCCARIVAANRNCYRAQCVETARRIGDALGLPETQRRLCFQSRLGRTPWIRPYTDELLAAEARGGVKRAAILSPGFVADCLETLEELGLRAAATWRANGGERLDLIPCPNAGAAWVDALVRIASEHSSWLAPQAQGAGVAD